MTNHNPSLVDEISQGHYQIKGDITFETAMPILNAIQKHLDKQADLKIDLIKTQRCSSVAVALLLQIMEESCQQKINLHYLNIPSELIQLAKLSNIDFLFNTNE